MQDDNASFAAEIESVVSEIMDDEARWDSLEDTARYCLIEIACSLSNTPARIIELWNASGLTY